VLKDEKVDVVHLCTPNYLHFPQAKKALLAGKHVICEKPLALDTNESQELAKLAEKTGLIAAVNYNLRFYPICQEAHARVTAGDLGDVYLVHGGYLQDWLFYKTDWNWRLEPDQGGASRVVADIGSHWMDMIAFLTGLKIEAVMAEFSTIHKKRLKPQGEVETFVGKIDKNTSLDEVPIDTEDTAVVLFRFENGALGNVTLSQVSAGRKNYFWYEINGSKESMRWDQESPNQIWIGNRDQPNQILLKDPSLFHENVRSLTGFPGGHAEGYPDTFAQGFTQIYAAIQRGKKNMDDTFASFEDGHHEMVLCEAIQLSANENRWVEINKAQ